MDFQEYNFGKDDIDRRLDKIIRRFLPETSLSEIYSLIRKGLIKINNKKTKENYHISENDVLNIAAFLVAKKNDLQKNESHSSLNLIDISKNIVFKNEHLLVINKPYDITVHGDKNSLDEAVKLWYQTNIKNDSISFKPGPLHRLDRKTTGLLVFSLSNKGARWFTENIENHVIQKSYLGIVQGKLSKQARWEDKLSKTENNSFVTVKIDEKNGKQAITTCYPIKQENIKENTVTLCRFDIETGRTHQIRCQSSFHGFPLLGDTAYGGKKMSGTSRDFYLHAWKLTFPENNPLGLPKEIVCEPSDDFLFV